MNAIQLKMLFVICICVILMLSVKDSFLKPPWDEYMENWDIDKERGE